MHFKSDIAWRRTTWNVPVQKITLFSTNIAHDSLSPRQLQLLSLVLFFNLSILICFRSLYFGTPECYLSDTNWVIFIIPVLILEWERIKKGNIALQERERRVYPMFISYFTHSWLVHCMKASLFQRSILYRAEDYSQW